MRTALYHTKALLFMMCITAVGVPGPTVAQQLWGLEQVLTIGSYDDEVTFGHITGLAVRPSGEILVLDQMEGTVLVFDAAGSPRGRIGKLGQGPGEFSNRVRGLYVTLGGALVVPDLGNSRVSFFANDASYSHSFRLDRMDGLPLAWATQGSDILLKEVQPRPTLPGMPERGPQQPAIMSIAHDGTELGMVPTFDLPSMFEFDAGGKMRTRVFPEVLVWGTTSAGHFIIGRSGLYRLEVRDIEGVVVAEITRDVRRRAVAAETRDRITREVADQLAEMDTPQAVKDMMGDPLFSDSLPVIGRPRNGPIGTILVRRDQGLVDAFSPDRQEAPAEDSPSAYDVHSLTDGYQGILELPPRYSLRAAHGNYIYGVAKDDFDVETVVVFRVSQPGN